MRAFRIPMTVCILAAPIFFNPFFLTDGIAKEESAPSKIVEIATFSDLLKYIKPKSLVLLDIDDTLMEAEQTMGTDRWFIWRQDYYAKRGNDSKLCFEKALMDWMAVQCLTKVKLTE